MQNWKRATSTALLAIITASAPLLATSSVLADSPASANPPIMAPVMLQNVTDQEVPANLPNPSLILVNGREVSFDQRPVVVDGTLMVPLRALTEATGGVVTWAEKNQSIYLDLSDRTVLLQVGQSESEVNMRGVMYIRRNMVAMAKAPVIMGNRTMISADALSSILGLMARDTGATLDLVHVAP